jgi:hypothetical protein
MQIKHTDDHTVSFIDDAGMSFMALTVHRLNLVLQANGIGDAAARQEICSSFLFDFGYHHDAGWLVVRDQKLFPMVCFAERAAPEEDENLGSIQTIHIPTEASSWHEYAHGVVSQYFEEDQEQVKDIRRGSYESED